MVIKDRPTPVLRGRDAREFERRMNEVKPLPPEVLDRIRRNFESVTIVNPETSSKRG